MVCRKSFLLPFFFTIFYIPCFTLRHLKVLLHVNWTVSFLPSSLVDVSISIVPIPLEGIGKKLVTRFPRDLITDLTFIPFYPC